MPGKGQQSLLGGIFGGIFGTGKKKTHRPCGFSRFVRLPFGLKFRVLPLFRVSGTIGTEILEMEAAA
jgi:hypothetical protein